MWIATDYAGATSQVVVYYADAPYGSWSSPVTVATGINADDIAVVTAMPGGQVGVLWSNQNTQRFGFKRHVDGADPGTWSIDEVPASQSAQNVGLGMADDHMNVAVASDGTLYAAVKTSYDAAGYPKIALLVRRSAGTWDSLYEVDQAGTRGIVLLDETAGVVTVLYTSVEGAGNILYKETPTAAIAFGASTVLMPGGLNDVTSTKQNLAGSVVILAGNGSSLSGRLLTTPAATYTITASAGAGGTITPSGAVSVGAGGSQAFTIAPSGGYVIADVLVDGGSVGAVASYTFTNVAASHTIAASFSPVGGPLDLVGWWKMDGNVDDSSGHGYHGAAVGAPAYVAGVAGQALNLSGTGQYAAVPDAPALRIPTNALTVATWVRPTVEGTQNLVSKSTNGGVGGFELCLAATSSTWPHKAFFRLNQVPSGDTYRINSTTNYSDYLGSWIHLAATYDGATMKLYVNGVLESSLAAAITINQNTLPLGLGAQVDASNAATRLLTGAMDDTRLYDRALDATEIAALAGLPLVTYTITASAGTGGSIAPSGAVVVAQGANQSFTITPAVGYHVDDVLVDAVSIGPVTSHTFTNVQSAHTIAASFALDVVAGDLVGHWRMDEGTGSFVADASPSGLHGTAVGGPTWVPGKRGPFALSFTNGTSRYVTVPDAASLDLTTAITMAAWIRPTQVATASIMNKATFASGPTYGYELDLSSTGVPFVRLFNDTQAAGGGRLNATIPYPTDGTTWMHVAATYDGTTIKMYINGVLNVTRASTSPIPMNSLPLVIGAPSDGLAARVFPGAIDDARLYNRALTAAEIAALVAVPTHTITASAGSGGSITPGGAVVVNDGASQSFAIAADPGYVIADVLVDGGSVGPVASHTFTGVYADHTISASFVTTGPPADNVAAVPAPGATISAPGWCLTVPVVFTRVNTTPLRGYSVTFELSPNLQLCGAQIVSAGYPQAPQTVVVTPLAGNRWTVDEVTLGFPCGVTGSATLFNLNVTSLDNGGTGTISVVSTLARDCTNGPLPIAPGLPATIIIEEGTVPVADAPLRTQFAAPWPTPFAASTTLQFELAKAGETELALFAVNGRRVRTITRGPQGVGIHRFTWDGADDQGVRVKPGVYFARLTTADGRHTQTVVLGE
jgi:hypothetical protein